MLKDQRTVDEVVNQLRKAFLSPPTPSLDWPPSMSSPTRRGWSSFAKSRGIPVEYHPAEALNAVSTPDDPSPHALAAVGAKGVCEPAALLSAESDILLIKKKIRGNVTVAVAEKI
jgi:cobalt-precorrin 5A hydrolase